MTLPCTQETAIQRIEGKLDKLTELLTDVAVQRSDITHLEKRMDKVELKVAEIDARPAGWLKSIAIAVVTAILAVIGSHFTR